MSKKQEKEKTKLITKEAKEINKSIDLIIDCAEENKLTERDLFLACAELYSRIVVGMDFSKAQANRSINALKKDVLKGIDKRDKEHVKKNTR